jgi:outer membrane protein OmpU
MNIKKIGLTALAASLVSVSANAGELSVAGSAKMAMEGFTGENLDAGTTFSMGNQVTMSGSGELDNGMTVSLSFVLDQGDDTKTTTNTSAAPSGGGAPFDSHSVSVSSDELGTLKLSGEGGASTASSIDTTAAGDIWDNFDGTIGKASGAKVKNTEGGDNSLFYTLPSILDDLTVNLSYKPQGSSAGSEQGYGFAYTGVEGLTLKYAMTDHETGTGATSGDDTVIMVEYAYGPVTVAASEKDYDVETASDQEVSSYQVSYTISDELSVSYGVEEITKASSEDAEYSMVSGSYTAGGMTISASVAEAENVAHGTASSEDFDYWSLSASFAF